MITHKKMAKIDIHKFVEEHGLDRKEVEQLLFPTAKHPYYALNRVASGKGLLDSEQMYKLAELAGVPVSALYDHKKWKMDAEDKRIIFETEDYKAILDKNTWITKIFHKGSMFHESVLTPGTTSMSTYLQELDRIVDENKLM